MLKRFLMVLGVVSLLLPMPTVAEANDNGAYLLGGIVGGLLLGEALDNHRRYREPVYIEEPVYEKQCYTQWVRRWSEYRHAWVSKPQTYCDWVRVR